MVAGLCNGECPVPSMGALHQWVLHFAPCWSFTLCLSADPLHFAPCWMLILYTLLLFSTGGHCYYSLLWQEEVSTLKCKLLPLHCTVHSSWDHRSRWQSSTFYTLKPAAKNSAGQCVHGRAAGVNAEVQTFCATSPPPPPPALLNTAPPPAAEHCSSPALLINTSPPPPALPNAAQHFCWCWCSAAEHQAWVSSHKCDTQRCCSQEIGREDSLSHLLNLVTFSPLCLFYSCDSQRCFLQEIFSEVNHKLVFLTIDWLLLWLWSFGLTSWCLERLLNLNTHFCQLCVNRSYIMHFFTIVDVRRALGLNV